MGCTERHSMLENLWSWNFSSGFLNPPTFTVRCLPLSTCFCLLVFVYFTFFFSPFLAAFLLVMLVDQCWDLLYLLHISSAAPFRPRAPFISTVPPPFLFFYICTSDNAAALSLFTADIKSVWRINCSSDCAEVTERVTETNAGIQLLTHRLAHICMCGHVHASKYINRQQL